MDPKKGPLLRWGLIVWPIAFLLAAVWIVPTNDEPTEQEIRETVAEVLAYTRSADRNEREDQRTRLKLGELSGSNRISFQKVLSDLNAEDIKALHNLMQNPGLVDPSLDLVDDLNNLLRSHAPAPRPW